MNKIKVSHNMDFSYIPSLYPWINFYHGILPPTLGQVSQIAQSKQDQKSSDAIDD